MKPMIVIVALLGAIIGSLDDLQAQAAPITAIDSAFFKMRSALRAISSAQELHYSATGTYTTELEVLRKYPSCVIDAEVVVKIPEAGKSGWAGEATHPKAPGESCVYWVGARDFEPHPLTKGRKRESKAAPGRAICDRDAISP
ncbi:MAG: hypothetical protein ACT4O1_10530 [Gemmatimonadota bacterium]